MEARIFATFVYLDAWRAIDGACSDSQRYPRAGVINRLINAWLLYTRFAVISIGKRSSVTNFRCFRARTQIHRRRSLEKKLSTVHWQPGLVIYLRTERRMVDDHQSATRYSFYVLWLNQPGYMRTLCPNQRDEVKNGASSRMESRGDVTAWGVVIAVRFRLHLGTACSFHDNTTRFSYLLIYYNSLDSNLRPRHSTIGTLSRGNIPTCTIFLSFDMHYANYTEARVIVLALFPTEIRFKPLK